VGYLYVAMAWQQQGEGKGKPHDLHAGRTAEPRPYSGQIQKAHKRAEKTTSVRLAWTAFSCLVLGVGEVATLMR